MVKYVFEKRTNYNICPHNEANKACCNVIFVWGLTGEIIPNNGLRYRMHRAGSLEFSAVKVEDSGVYKCTAKNEAGSESRAVKLSIQGR